MSVQGVNIEYNGDRYEVVSPAQNNYMFTHKAINNHEKSLGLKKSLYFHYAFNIIVSYEGEINTWICKGSTQNMPHDITGHHIKLQNIANKDGYSK